MRKIVLAILFILLVVISIFLAKHNNYQNNQPSGVSLSSPHLLTNDQAIYLVKKLPEVETYLKDHKEATESGVYYSAGTIDIDSDRTNKNFVTVHVYQYTQPLNQNFGMAQSFNYYTFDRETGKIKCQFAIFDEKGNFIRVTNDYPCN